jgi:hypothetical protein
VSNGPLFDFAMTSLIFRQTTSARAKWEEFSKDVEIAAAAVYVPDEEYDNKKIEFTADFSPLGGADRMLAKPGTQATLTMIPRAPVTDEMLRPELTA